jgi:hypothetical protein
VGFSLENNRCRTLAGLSSADPIGRPDQDLAYAKHANIRRRLDAGPRPVEKFSFFIRAVIISRPLRIGQ